MVGVEFRVENQPERFVRIRSNGIRTSTVNGKTAVAANPQISTPAKEKPPVAAVAVEPFASLRPLCAEMYECGRRACRSRRVLSYSVSCVAHVRHHEP